MHNSESVLLNKTRKIPWDFDTQTNHIIFTRRPDLVIVNKKTPENLPNCELYCPGRPQSKIEGRR